MKILNLGLDASLFEQDSGLARRTIEYGKSTERYDVLVPFFSDKKMRLSERVEVFGVFASNKILAFLKIYRQARELIQKNNYDLITVQDVYYLAFLAFLLKQRFTTALELQVHGFEKYKGTRKIIAKFVLKRADAVRCVSERLKKQLIREFGVEGGKITVVPIFSKLPDKNIESPKKEDGKFVFLTVGRLVKVKNIALQIRAFREMIDSLDTGKKEELELWIAGDGDERKNLENLVISLNLKDRVKFLGWQDDLNSLYGRADCFLLSSDYEGWGLVIAEAAAFSLPIVMTDVGCAGELVHDSESALVVKTRDCSAFALGMNKIYSDKKLREALGANALRALDKLPTWEETLALYEESRRKALLKLGS